MKQLSAESHWFLTATPVVNNALVSDHLSPYQYWHADCFEQDILGLLRLLWPRAKAALESDPDAKEWVSLAGSSFDVFEKLDALAATDKRRLIAIDPSRHVYSI